MLHVFLLQAWHALPLLMSFLIILGSFQVFSPPFIVLYSLGQQQKAVNPLQHYSDANKNLFGMDRNLLLRG